jgi:hypothetical protein
LVEERGVFGEAHHRPDASHWQTLAHHVVSSTSRHERDTISLHKYKEELGNSKGVIRIRIDVEHSKHNELLIKLNDTTDTARSASNLNLQLEANNEGRIKTLRQRDYFNYPIVKFPFICSNIPAAPLHMGYTFPSWSDIPELVVHIRVCLIEGCCYQGNYWTKDYYWLSWSQHFESFTVTTMTWFNVVDYLCHKWPQIWYTCHKHSQVLSSFMTYHHVCN